MMLDNANCTGTETTLLNCSRHELVPVNNNHCNHNSDISVRCILREDQRLKNITIDVEIISAPSNVHTYTALISWMLYNTTMNEPSSFDIKCSNEWHGIAMSVNGQTFTTHLLGLLPITSYNCCVSDHELYIADGVCKNITTPGLFITSTTTLILITKLSNSKASESNNTVVVGGVLGSIVVILFVLLTVALVYSFLWHPKRKKNAKPSM